MVNINSATFPIWFFPLKDIRRIGNKTTLGTSRDGLSVCHFSQVLQDIPKASPAGPSPWINHQSFPSQPLPWSHHEKARRPLREREAIWAFYQGGEQGGFAGSIALYCCVCNINSRSLARAQSVRAFMRNLVKWKNAMQSVILLSLCGEAIGLPTTDSSFSSAVVFCPSRFRQSWWSSPGNETLHSLDE